MENGVRYAVARAAVQGLIADCCAVCMDSFTDAVQSKQLEVATYAARNQLSTYNEALAARMQH